jgi:hypothetical protein
VWIALYHHAVWLLRYPSLYSSANNHRVAELSALIVLGHSAPAIPGLKVELCENELIGLLPRQQYCDGVGTEQSISYQALCMEWLLYVQCICPRLQESIHGFLRLGCRFLVALIDENGNTPLIGDLDNSVVLRSVLHNENSILSVCGAAAHVVGDQYAIPHAYKKDLRFDLLGLDLMESKHIVQSMHFPKGGYSVLHMHRTMLLLDHGPLGFDSTGGHGHADALSLWMHHEGHPVWIDWGMYRYNGEDSYRRFARSTEAHNTVVVGGRDQSMMSGPFNWRSRAKSRVVSIDLHRKEVCAEHDGYGVLHRRTVQLIKEGIVIVDRLMKACSESVEVCFWLSGRFDAISCEHGWIILEKEEEIATFLLKDSRFMQKKREIQEHGISYNTFAPALGLFWQAQGVQEWKIEWKWKERR